jgi:hypothetical protein
MGALMLEDIGQWLMPIIVIISAAWWIAVMVRRDS